MYRLKSLLRAALIYTALIGLEAAHYVWGRNRDRRRRHDRRAR
jgi:hypothetical protein